MRRRDKRVVQQRHGGIDEMKKREVSPRLNAGSVSYVCLSALRHIKLMDTAQSPSAGFGERQFSNID